MAGHGSQVRVDGSGIVREGFDEQIAETRSTHATPERKRVLRGAAFVVISGILWGFSGTCGQLLTQNFGIDSRWVVTQRLIWSAIFFLVGALIFDRRNVANLIKKPKSLIQLVAYAIFGIIGCQLFYQETIAWTNAGTGTLMEQLALIVVLVVTCSVERRPPRIIEIIGVVLALLGVFLVSTHGNPASLAMPVEGLLWGLLAAVGMACYVLLPVPLLKEHGSFTVTAPAMVVAAIASLIMFRPWAYDIELSLPVVSGTAGMIICGTILAYLFFLQGVRDTGPMLAGLLETVELVAAFAISAVWLGTPVGIWDIAGSLCIMGMMVMMTMSGKTPSDR